MTATAEARARILELFDVTEQEIAELDATDGSARDQADRIRESFHLRLVAATAEAERELLEHLAVTQRAHTASAIRASVERGIIGHDSAD